MIWISSSHQMKSCSLWKYSRNFRNSTVRRSITRCHLFFRSTNRRSLGLMQTVALKINSKKRHENFAICTVISNVYIFRVQKIHQYLCGESSLYSEFGYAHAHTPHTHKSHTQHTHKSHTPHPHKSHIPRPHKSHIPHTQHYD